MSATDQGVAAGTPLTPYELAMALDAYARDLRDSADATHGYTESFAVKKTDIAPNTGAAVAARRIILNGDVSSVEGWSITETTGAAAAKVSLLDGNNASAEVIATIGLASAASSNVFVPRRGIEVFTGRVFLLVTAGSVQGVLYWR